MSKLAEFKALEAQLAAQLQQLDAMKNDSGLKQEIEYGMNLRQVITILDPSKRKREYFQLHRRSAQAA